MMRYVTSLLLGTPMTLAVLMFMAMLVGPDNRPRQSSEARNIVIKMPEVPEPEVGPRVRPVPPEPVPKVAPVPILPPVAAQAQPPLVIPPLDIEPTSLDIAAISPIKLAMPDIAVAIPDPAALIGTIQGQQRRGLTGVAGVGAINNDDLRPLQRIDPLYPSRAQQAGIEGEVTLKFIVDPDGQVRNVAVVSAKPRGQFERAAIQALRQWRYPARQGAREAITQRISLKFRLED